jgi:hypothetical protein
MMHALTSLNPIAILVIAIATFIFGGLWFSPLLFVKAWFKEMKTTPEEMKAQSKGMAKTFGPAIALTLVSTTVLATVIAAHNVSSPAKGAELGLFLGAGLVAAREGVNDVFSNRSLKLFLIVAGHDVALFTIQGAILAVWR